MDSRHLGAELSQLARLLFNAAANKWYGSVFLEVAAGLLAAIISASEPSGDWPIFGAIAGVALLFGTYGLRLWFDDQYDAAETMRRQAVLTEGLDWPLDPIQTSEWCQKAGKRIRDRLKAQPRDPDYYDSKAQPGGRRLAEMTVESSFYTRHLYGKLRLWIWILFVGAILVAVFVISLALTQTIPDRIDTQIARTLYSAIPVVVSINLLGWALRLSRSISAIRQVESDLERLLGTAGLDEKQAMRLVSEYNCQMVGGFPIHSFLFIRWQKEIQDLWQQRQRQVLRSHITGA